MSDGIKKNQVIWKPRELVHVKKMIDLTNLVFCLFKFDGYEIYFVFVFPSNCQQIM